MEFEHNYIPKDLRPINVPRTVTEELPRIAAPSTATAETAAANAQFFPNLDGSVPLFYQANAPDSAFVYANPPPVAWAPRLPVGSVNLGITSPAVSGFGYSPNLGTRMVSNAVDHSGNEVIVPLSAIAHPVAGNRVATSELAATPVNYSPNSGTRGSGGDYGSEEGGDDSVSGKKVKFLCSFGGKIFPRPSDGMLRYVGGQTRIISVRRDVSFTELMQKMADTCGQAVVTKYQLPYEDLDALVSVSCPDDLDNMMDEYEKLVEKSADGSAKLRVFLFSANELDSPSGAAHLGDLHDNGLRYVEAVNGIVDSFSNGIARRGSIASATSTQNSDHSANEGIDSSQMDVKSNPATPHDCNPKLVPLEHNLVEISMVKSGSPQHIASPKSEVEFERSIPVTLGQRQLGYDYQQAVIGTPPLSSPMQAYFDPNRTDYRHQHSQMRFHNAQMIGTIGSAFTQQQIRDTSVGVSPHGYVSAVHMTMAPTSHVAIRPTVQPLVQPQQTRMEHYNAYQPQHPAPVIGGGYALHHVPQTERVIFSDGLVCPQQVAFSEKIPRLEDCLMCQKALPHAHSDPLVQNQKESGVCAVPDSHSIHQSLLNSPVDHQVGLQQPETLVFVQSPSTVSKTNHCVPGLSTITPQSRLVDSANQYLVPSKCINSPHYAGVIQAPVRLGHQSPQSPVEFYGMLPGVTSKGNHAVESSISSGQLSPIDGMMESVWITPPEVSDNSELNQPSMGKLREEIIENTSQQTPERNIHLDATYNEHPVAIDSTQFNKQNDVMEASYAYNSQQIGSYPQSQIGVHLLDNDGASYGTTAFSGTEAAFVVDRTSPAHWAVRLQSAVGPADMETQLNPKSSLSSSGEAEDVQDSSNSLFSNQDPWNLRHDAHFPPKPNKILARKDDFESKDAFCGNNSSYGGESITDGVLTDVINNQLPNNSKDCDSEQVQSSQGSAEELIKQELQAVAEDVAASVFSLVSPCSDSRVLEQKESTHEDSQDKATASEDTEIQQKANFEDVVSKVPEKLNFGFPVSGGLGRLQIIKNSDLEELQELGSGTFGTVYHGKWRGTDVAIKRINERCFAGKPSEQERMIEDFWNEAIKLAELHHPNVVAFYGMVLDGPGGSVATVTEYMVNGSLRNSLQKNERSLDKRKQLLVAMDVAFGMEYLHGKNIVHFDLKSDNLLVNLRDPHRPICKVGDLGLSKVKCQTLISGGVRGTLPWMAPELLNGSSSLVSEKVDVFSFGIVLWELLTGEEPYADLHYGAIIGGIVSNTLRPAVPESCDPEWKELMERCWSSEPSERPDFTTIANELRAMATKTPPKAQNSAQP